MPTEEELAAAAAAEETEQTEEKETHDGFIDLESHQKDVNVQHKRFRDEERGRVKERDRADAAEKELDELKGKQAEVVIPPVPNRDSETYEADVKDRDDAIAAKATQTADNEQAQAKRKEEDEARQVEDSAALNKRVATFDSNLAGHGLKAAEVKAAAEAVIGFGISNTFQDILLDDKDGPLMVKYLEDKPLEAEQMNAMSTMELVNHLNTEVRPKALLLKPQTSAAPDPPVVLDGGGAPETPEPWEKGAVYE